MLIRNTFGYCTDASSTFVQEVDRLLPDTSAINLGVNGYTSFQGYKTLVEIGDSLNPRVIVVSFNFNDRRYVLSEDAADGDAVFRERALMTKRANLIDSLRVSYVVRAVLLLVQATGIVKDSDPPEVDLRDLHPRVNLDSYRQNLTRIVEWAREHDSQVLFLLLGDNPVRSAYLRKGIEGLDAGRYDAAIDQLRVAMRDKVFGDLARLYLAQAYTRAGMPEKAENITLVKPQWSLDGGHPIRLDAAYNQVMREVGSNYQVEIVDARKKLNQAPGDYIDATHFDVEGHKKVAHMLHTKIDRLLRHSKR